ncbi:BAQ_1a_G0039470.mRNA.1.CDS.1 [Saccharomyces cerevisiae]|nr:BAQ_1a_G0039470.mRNA.1.CDS.1 [Saccharomyces cerevisiae]CAI4679413.1 BAM_G0039460.mRNA.1.CDS.1 [Saccharomyces cerevisiae]CAI7255360.1 BAM_G0039460.mRNA.1.CDS.1 [Saccharomyces cerevisiae]CAI7256427.1 BAQ_1a_G0039470.mRNA.1.CDS.1 [Saccharomyces cerevisiae]
MTDDEKREILKEFDPFSQLEQANGNPDKDVKFKKDDPNRAAAEETNRDISAQDKGDEEPFYDFQIFIKQLQTPGADPLVKYTKSFLRNFLAQRLLWTVSEEIKLISDFKTFIYDKFTLYEPFRSLDNSKMRNAKEGMEKLIMGKLYSRCFSPSLYEILQKPLDDEHMKDLTNDDTLLEKIRHYRFISPIMLDIPDTMPNARLNKFVHLASKELGKINRFKSPRDKMVCVLNASKVIFGLLKHTKLEQNGADSFIPVLIYCILKGQVRYLVSNVNYIERFRSPDFIRGEEEYYLSSLQAALNFIMNLTERSLTIEDHEDFEEAYQRNLKQLAEEKEEEEKKKQLEVPDELQPNGTLLKPLDEVTNIVISKFNELFSPIGEPTQEEALKSEQSNKEEDVSSLIKKIEENERKDTLNTLQSMFPDMDPSLIEDVCIAKKSRIGPCVDALLSLSE